MAVYDTWMMVGGYGRMPGSYGSMIGGQTNTVPVVVGVEKNKEDKEVHFLSVNGQNIERFVDPDDTTEFYYQGKKFKYIAKEHRIVSA